MSEPRSEGNKNNFHSMARGYEINIFRIIILSWSKQTNSYFGHYRKLLQRQSKADLDGATLSHVTNLRHDLFCKSNLQLAYDCRVRHKKCRMIWKHVKPCDMS